MTISPGDFVLKRFKGPSKNITAHDEDGNPVNLGTFGGEVMWVLVADIRDDIIYGRLASNPLAVDLKHDQYVSFPMKDIEGYKKGKTLARFFYRALRFVGPGWEQGSKVSV